jgi:enamine deaminase RidA (YjgF/YER057c/UK114 family)
MYKARGYTWSDLVKKGKVISISGTVATDENHRTLFKGDLLGQTRRIYEIAEKLLARAGATFDDVIKTTDYITPQAVAEYGKTAEIRREFFGDPYPAATGIVVHSLLSPNWLIEIEFLAVLE